MDRRRKREAEKAAPVGGRKLAGMPELAAIPRREKSGRVYRPRETFDPQTQQLKARCRHMGMPITNANLREMRQPYWGCYAGRVIGERIMPENERVKLWGAILHMRQVIVAYDAAIGAPRRHAVCLRLLQGSSALEADAASPALDTRDDEAKARQAVAAMMRLEGWMGHGDKHAVTMAKGVVWDDQACPDGNALIEVLLDVAYGLSGKRFPRDK